MTYSPPKLSQEVEEAMETVLIPGLWEVNEDGDITVGIDGDFDGYALEASVIKEQLGAWMVLAKYYGVIG
jgi:hypothetical protein